jgi:hypothetical protein
MNEDFMQYVYARIEKALSESAEYRELARKCGEVGNDIMLLNKEFENLVCQEEIKSQELCYLQGYNDAIKLFTNLK